jgi:hypothetical protein
VAIKATLKRAIERIASALDDYGFDHGYGRGSGKVYVNYDPEWGTIGITYVGPGFESQDQFKRFESVLNYLEDKLADDPALFRSIRLVVWDEDQVNSGRFSTSLTDSDVPIEDFLISGPVR